MANNKLGESSKTKLAVFDVDGTLFDGTLGIELLKDLLEKGLFPKDVGQEIYNLYKKYKTNEGNKADIVDKIYKLYGKGMEGLSVYDVNNTANNTWSRIKNQIFTFSEYLVTYLKENNYRVILISGSSIEMVSIFGNELDINESNIIAGQLAIEDGQYTNKIIHYPGSAKQKKELLFDLLNKQNVKPDWPNSLSMGNNERDVSILKLCGKSFIFEPNEKLYKLSEKANWIMVNRGSANYIPYML